MNAREKVLLVDDEPKLLFGLRRQLAQTFPIVIAASGRDGLRKLETEGPFAVVVADMAMPQMDGITFLKEVEKRAPDAIRMMLTGDGRAQTAANAVNYAGVFRFLCKPCEHQVMSAAIGDALNEYRRRQSEDLSTRGGPDGHAISGLSTMLTRELRTPLNHIIGCADQLSANMAADDENLLYVKHIKDSSTDLLKTINRLTVIGAAESGTLALQRCPTPISRIVAECFAYVGELDPDQTLTFETEVAANFPDLLIDAVAFRQVLFSLLSNAVKFNTAGGTVRLKAALDRHGLAKLEISDTGTGMAPRFMARALEPFGQAQSPLGRTLCGVGTGLPLAKALTELHGGVFRLDSELGVGTRATVLLTAESISGTASAADGVIALPPPAAESGDQTSAGTQGAKIAG